MGTGGTGASPAVRRFRGYPQIPQAVDKKRCG